MDKQDRGDVLKKLKTIGLALLTRHRPEPERTQVLCLRPEVMVLADKEIDLWRDVLNILLQRCGWSEKYSEKDLEHRLTEVLLEVVTQRSIHLLGARLDSLSAEYAAYNTARTVYLRVEGLTLDFPKLELGPVNLVVMDSDRITEINSKLVRIINATADSKQVKLELTEQTERDLQQHFVDGVYAKYQVVAEPRRAFERAEIDTRRVIEILRFWGAFASGAPEHTALGLPGQLGSDILRTPIIADDETSFNWSESWVGALFPVTLDADALERMDELGIMGLFELLASPESDLTDFERALLRSLHWFGDAQIQRDVANRVLSLVTSLECLFTSDKDERIAATIATGCASVLEPDEKKRSELRKWLLDIYDHRSRVSHGGSYAALDVDVANLRTICRDALSTLIRRRSEFETRADLAKWIRALNTCSDHTDPQPAEALRSAVEALGSSNTS